MRHIILRNTFIIISGFSLIFYNCSEDKINQPDPAVITIIVKSGNDSSTISGANAVLYNANSGEAVSRTFTDNNGTAKFETSLSGNFYVKLSAQGFYEIPEGSVSPVPFSVSSGQTFSQTYYMDVQPGVFGKIDGTVTPNQSGFLIVATSLTAGSEFHTYSGPDGYFVLFNVPYDAYSVNSVKAGYQLSVQPEIVLSASVPAASIQFTLNQITGSSLNGKVTFLAVENGIVDISLLDDKSLSVVNGLTTEIDINRDYSLSKIPAGNYTAWASYKNDGYVMDPDWLFKNPGALNISFTTDTAKILNFSVTGAISLIAPTNPSASIIPAAADSVVPTFYWNAYPQAKEYIIEVRDVNGKLLWGGFNGSGEIRHAQIPKEWNSVEFNFDGTALSQLNSGDIYQWRIYADDDAVPNIQTLLSSSEDLMGLFIAP